MSDAELDEIIKQGAVAKILGWSIDARGRMHAAGVSTCQLGAAPPAYRSTRRRNARRLPSSAYRTRVTRRPASPPFLLEGSALRVEQRAMVEVGAEHDGRAFRMALQW
ncbi:hypothetical protein KPG66_14480 [Mycetohabitans sp. B2]|nr:hypothetical protein [Mycetohabitans sp. B2]